MLIEMELREVLQGIDVDPTIVLVGKEDETKELPILIGMYEVQMLTLAIKRETQPRPLTHDLIINVLDGVGGTLRCVIVDMMSEDPNTRRGFYHGKLDVELNDHTHTLIDSRPSDAIVLATKLGVPIYVEDDVIRSQEPPDDEDVENGEGEEDE